MHMMSVVDLMGNAVHPSVLPDVHDGYCRLGGKCGVHPTVLPDVHDGICGTPTGKYSTPSEAPDAHDVCCRLDGKCSTSKCAS